MVGKREIWEGGMRSEGGDNIVPCEDACMVRT